MHGLSFTLTEFLVFMRAVYAWPLPEAGPQPRDHQTVLQSKKITISCSSGLVGNTRELLGLLGLQTQQPLSSSYEIRSRFHCGVHSRYIHTCWWMHKAPIYRDQAVLCLHLSVICTVVNSLLLKVRSCTNQKVNCNACFIFNHLRFRLLTLQYGRNLHLLSST